MYMITFQKEFTLEPKARGFHLITSEIQREIPELEQIGNGIAHIFICHTSAALTLNENADPSVRRDFESHFNRMVPEETSMYEHTIEGSDDMTSHIKSSLWVTPYRYLSQEGVSIWVRGRASGSVSTG